MPTEYAIEMKGITKTFGSVVANRDVELNVRQGEILALLGENGSGKTTLMNMLSGIYKPDSGTILVNGRQAVINSPEDAKRLGIGMVHQHFKLVDIFSAADNIWLGDEKSGPILKKDRYAVIQEMARKFGFDIDPRKKVYNMAVSEKQTLEIIKVLYYGAKVIILDEPTAGLDPKGRDTILEQIRVYQEQIVKWGMIYQSRAVSLSQGDATERFEWFCKEYPGMIDMVNNRYIASFLGITPVTLSRLRHGVATKVGREKRTDEE